MLTRDSAASPEGIAMGGSVRIVAGTGNRGPDGRTPSARSR